MKHNIKVVITSVAFSKSTFLKQEIEKYFSDIKFNVKGERLSKRELVDFMRDSDAVIVGLDKIDKELLDSCKNLKIISKYGVGLDNIDIEECENHHVAVGWTGGVNKRSVAEMALGFMLMLSRNLYVTSNQLKSGIWNKSGGFELSRKIVGIIGIGHIGKDLISLLKPFNCEILVNDVINQDDYYQENGLKKASKYDIYEKADIVTVHTPLNDKTKNMIGLDEMKLMKKNSYLINTARGGIVNEDDLLYALENKIIAGAALDIYVSEPPINEGLISIPNLISTPHIGGNSTEAIESMGISAIKHLVSFFNMRNKYEFD